jgi:Zn finger protein HypA/HybF involved in hydrogenase expression
MGKKKPNHVFVWCQFCEITNLIVILDNNDTISERLRNIHCPKCGKHVLEVYNPKIKSKRKRKLHG